MATTQQVYDDEVSLEIKDGIALVTFIATEGQFPWKTKREEHRMNHVLMGALVKALDAVEAAGQDANVLVVANEGKFWCNGGDLTMMDTKEVDKKSQKDAGRMLNEVMTRLLGFPIPTIAAIRGHWTAGGGYLGLCFDYRCMSSDRGVFFIPGVDLGIVYPPFSTELATAKLDKHMLREVILFNRKRWAAEELVAHGAVDIAAPTSELLEKALELAASLKPKGQGPARKALAGIKQNVYKRVLDAVHEKGAGGAAFKNRARGVAYAPPAKL